MTSLTTKQLVEVIQRSRLLDAEVLKSAVARLKAQHGGTIPPDGTALGELLVEERLVTPWQYDRLRKGKHRGFFLGKYRLLSHLGSGGMSSVYLADHELMNRQVAIKVLPPNRVKDQSYLERFYLEAKAVAAVDHPNIVRAYDVDSVDDTHFIVMEFVRGSDLSRLIRNSDRLPSFAEATDYIIQAARGLSHAHASGLIHRDVKPANLLVDDQGTVKVLDLGLALFKGEETSLTNDHDVKVLGTADYLAPEQALNSHEVDLRVDIYSLGCTLFFLLTGRPPFHEGTLAQRIAAHQSVAPPRVRMLRPDCPEPLAEICHRMMAKLPAERYPTAMSVAEALETWRRASKAHLPVEGKIPLIVTDAHGVVGDRLPGNQVSDVPSNESIQIMAAAEPQLLSKRKRRWSRSRKPPLMLWVILSVLSLVAIGLLVFLWRR